MTNSPYIEQPREKWDALVTAGVFAVSLLLLWVWSYPGIHPLVWNDLAVAAGLRPPEQPFPGVYRALLSLLFGALPTAQVLDLLPWIGRIAIALATTCVYMIFRDILPPALRLTAHVGRISGHLGRIVAVETALLFLCADPIWRSGQIFAPATVFIVLAVLSQLLFFAFVRKGRIAPLYLCFIVLGVLSGETPVGMLMALITAFGVLLAAKLASNAAVPLVNPFVDGLVRVVVFKRLTRIWGFFFVATLALDVWQFMHNGGITAAGGHEDVLGVLLVCLMNAISATKSSMMPTALLFAPLLAMVPFLLAVRLLPKAWDDDRFLPFLVGVVYAAVGAIAVSQLSSARVLWFWTWLRAGSMIPSDTVLSFVLMFDVAAASFALAVFGVDACCRNYRRIAKQQFPESMQYAEPAKLAESLGKARTFRRRLFMIALVLVPVCTLPGRRQPAERGMLAAMRDYAEETLRETVDCDAMFTDGSFDCLLEVLAKSKGRTFNCLSMMAPNNPREKAIRMRVSHSDEDEAVLANDAETALRNWVAHDEERMKHTAVQLGLELWKKNKSGMPPLSGLVALPGGIPNGDAAWARVVVGALADRVCDLARDHNLAKCPDPTLKAKYPFVPFRLARMAQIRSLDADQRGRREDSFREAAMADELDRANFEMVALREQVDWHRKQKSGVLTPREGLVIGLSRADFALAGQYAAPILRTNPDDPRANFAMGMKYFQEERWSRAEEHLLRCLEKRPNEPAVLNNLALAEIRLVKLDEALKHAQQAVASNPDLVECRRTLEKVQKAIEERKEKNEKNQN